MKFVLAVMFFWGCRLVEFMLYQSGRCGKKIRQVFANCITPYVVSLPPLHSVVATGAPAVHAAQLRRAQPGRSTGLV